jgi:hypothetical protein
VRRFSVNAWRRASALAAIAGVTLFASLAHAEKPQTPLAAPITTIVTAIPIDFDRENPDRKEFGRLIFRAGLNLYAKTIYFGGYSAIAIDPTGRSLLAISDAGTWMRASLDHDGRKLKGLRDVVVGPMLGTDGKPLQDDATRDSEGMTLIDGDTRQGTAYVSVERTHRIARYPFTASTFGPPAGTVPLPAATKGMTANSGMEAITMIRAGKLKGTLIAFAEHLADKNGNLRGWMIGGPTPGEILVKRIAGFDITDAAALPDGGIVLLERKFSYSEGINMRIRRIAASELKRGTPITGQVLLQANDSLNIDNMEAIAAYRAPSGETVLTLMSDDNFSAIQRTLIMQFTLPETEPVTAGPPG